MRIVFLSGKTFVSFSFQELPKRVRKFCYVTWKIADTSPSLDKCLRAAPVRECRWSTVRWVAEVIK